MPEARVDRVEYHLVQRYVGRWGDRGWWRPVVGAVSLVALFYVIGPVLVQIPFLAGYALSGADVEEAGRRLVDLDHVTPMSLAYLNLALSVAIPAALVLTRVLHGVSTGWVTSVVGRLRWRWMAVTFGLAFLALLSTLFVGALMPSAGEAVDSSGGLNNWTSTTRDFVLVILFLTPLQAAGEEFAFRGYLTQAFGGIFAPLGPRVARAAAVLAPATLFAIAHGSQDAPTFVARLAFGLVAGILVIETGGLEAGIAMHVLNNFLAYGFALAFSDMTSAINPTDGSWWSLPTVLTQSLVYLALAIWAARRMGVSNVVERSEVPNVLEDPERRV